MNRQYAGFGLRWQSDVPLTRFTPCAEDAPAHIFVHLRSSLQERELLRLQPGQSIQRAADGFRYLVPDHVALDVFGGDRIDVVPGPHWLGELPAAFYATVTALLLARRGMIPLHGSTVAMDGQAVLICGPSGAGKSTLAAGLIARGAQLISDDLSILRPHPATGQYVFSAGRRTMRLFGETAKYLEELVPLREAPYPAEGKVAVAPPQVEPFQVFPLTKVLLLEDAAGKTSALSPLERLTAQLFRPKWMERLPGRELRLAALAIAVNQLELISLTPLAVRNRESFLQLAELAASNLLSENCK